MYARALGTYLCTEIMGIVHKSNVSEPTFKWRECVCEVGCYIGTTDHQIVFDDPLDHLEQSTALIREVDRTNRRLSGEGEQVILIEYRE